MINPNWFVYHQPTDVTGPKFKAIRMAEFSAQRIVDAADFDTVNDLCLKFAQVIDDNCPDCDDKKRAIDAVRLARNGANECIVIASDDETLRSYVVMKLREARWLANSAIALEGE